MRVAAVDIGTNTVRLLIVDRDRVTNRSTLVHRRSVVTRLGEDVDRRRRLDHAAIERVLAVLRSYRATIDSQGVEATGAVATSAVRDAANGEQFLEAAERDLGVRPRLISGRAEARLSFLGVRSGLDIESPMLVIDPGGGSTEFVVGDSEPDYAVSVDIGSVRLTERHLVKRPAAMGDLDGARADLDRLLNAVELPVTPRAVVGVGGTFTSLAAILLDLPEYDSVAVHGASFPVEAFDEIAARLAGLTVAETAAIPSLDPARAPVLLGGAMVAARALRHVGASRAVVSEADILDGIALTTGQ